MHHAWPKKDKHKNEDNLKNEDDLKNEADLKIEDDLKNWPIPLKIYLMFCLMTSHCDSHFTTDV